MYSYDRRKANQADDMTALADCVADAAAQGVVHGLQKSLRDWGFSDKDFQYRPGVTQTGSAFELEIQTPNGKRKFNVRVTRG